MVRKIDKSTGEITNIPVVGLWAPMPVPAIKLLADNNEHNSLRVLNCLVSYIGSNGFKVWPSYDLIISDTGLSRPMIKPALDVLVDYGFIKITKLQMGKTKKRNIYYIQECCYQPDRMPKHVKKKLRKSHRCLGCVKEISRGEYTTGINGDIHIGCGGNVIPLGKKTRQLTNQEEVIEPTSSIGD